MLNKDLSPAKRALLNKWLNGQVHEPASGIPKRPAGSPVPLSFPQRRQLFLELLHRGTAVNNLSVMLALKGALSVPALQESANRILSRHDSLRTFFCFRNGLPTVDLAVDTCLTLPVVDLPGRDENEQLANARRLAEQEVLLPFDLLKAPLVHLKLFRADKDLHLLLLVVHHTIADGWSLGVFLKELSDNYRGIITGLSKPHPELPIQYADFAHWQTGEQFDSVQQSAIAYWKKQLSGDLPVLELPSDHGERKRQTFSGGTHRFVISKHRTDALEKISSESDSTLFMTLLSVFFVLLSRYSGQDEMIVGTPVANRNHPELQNMIGVFINTLALRLKRCGNPRFRSLLRQVRQLCLDAYAHQDLPFEKLVEVLKPQRDLSRTPIFQVVFNLQNSPMPKLEIPGIEASFLNIDRGVSQFDLTLMVSKLDGHCYATVEYNSEIFKAATISNMFRSFQVLLDEVIANPDDAIGSLQLLPEKERKQLVYGLNQTGADFPREKCLYQLFEAQVEQTPNAVAVIYEGQEFTYSNLNKRANAVARQLQAMGVGPESRVGICMEKSADLVVTLFAVQKAGGTYVPIHPSFPKERVQFILMDADVNVLLMASNPQSWDNYTIPVVKVCEPTSLIVDDANLQPAVTSERLAYIIYTSGSTGHPKGVMVSHVALVNFLWSMRQRPGMTKDDRLLSVTAISFDIAALELFLPLIVGATVIIADREMTSNPVLLGRATNDYKVTVMQATPAVWQLLLDTGWAGAPGLKALCGGEAWTRTLADQLLERVGSLWNMYGPTETTVWSSVAQIHKEDHPITIGTPIANTQLYLLDDHLQAVPTGVAGDLYIGGEGLARGYLNNELLTREKFIPDCFRSLPGTRIYKTGDRGRYLHDYSIELLGRSDDQVKIHGHRIELGEITTLLIQHPAVQKAVVITRTGTNKEKQIVAYVVAAAETFPCASELKDYLRRNLPVYMIPAHLIHLDNLPLSANGKIDREALPAPEEKPLLSDYVAPGNDMEHILTSIWQDVLDVENIGIMDNFFDLGGTSLQSLEIVAKAAMSGIPLTVENIFEHQTVARLSAHLKASS